MLGEELIDQRKEDREGIVSQVVTYTRVSKPWRCWHFGEFVCGVILCTVGCLGFPGGLDGKESACNAGNLRLVPRLGRSSGERNGYPLQYSCLGNLMDKGNWQAYSPWGREELDTDLRDKGSILRSERSPGGGHGNPPQYSCLENPMDRGVWQAMVCRVSQSWTRVEGNWACTHKGCLAAPWPLPIYASSTHTHPSAVTTKNVFKQCWMSPGRQSGLSWEPLLYTISLNPVVQGCGPDFRDDMKCSRTHN